MRTLPFPARVAAGLAASAAEQARKLPSHIAGLPVTVASHALQLSMRVQQEITELAIKGDEVLAKYEAGEDEPAWATFDEDAFNVGSPPAKAKSRARSDHDMVPADYDELSLQQLRGRLRRYSETELGAMLTHERTHQARPPFMRMLSNRIDTVRAQ